MTTKITTVQAAYNRLLANTDFTRGAFSDGLEVGAGRRWVWAAQGANLVERNTKAQHEEIAARIGPQQGIPCELVTAALTLAYDLGKQLGAKQAKEEGEAMNAQLNEPTDKELEDRAFEAANRMGPR